MMDGNPGELLPPSATEGYTRVFGTDHGQLFQGDCLVLLHDLPDACMDVFDPFGGSGTTYYAAEKMHRRWLGIEIGDTDAAIRRMRDYQNGIYVEWESARGNGAKRRHGVDQLKMFEQTTTRYPFLPLPQNLQH